MTAVRGLGDGAVGRAPGPRHPRTAAAYAPLFCAGGGNRENDDAEGPNTQLLWVGLTESECTSTTLLLLASYLGGNVTASDLRCEVGPPDLLPPPFTFTPKSRISSRNGCHRRCCLEPLSCAAAPVPRCRHPAHPTLNAPPPSTSKKNYTRRRVCRQFFTSSSSIYTTSDSTCSTAAAALNARLGETSWGEKAFSCFNDGQVGMPCRARSSPHLPLLGK